MPILKRIRESLSPQDLMQNARSGDLLITRFPEASTASAFLVTGRWTGEGNVPSLTVVALTPYTLPSTLSNLRDYFSWSRNSPTNYSDIPWVATGVLRLGKDSGLDILIPNSKGAGSTYAYPEVPVLGRDIVDKGSVVSIRSQHDKVPASSNQLRLADELLIKEAKVEMQRGWWYEFQNKMQEAYNELIVLSPWDVARSIFGPGQLPNGISIRDINYQGMEGKANAKELKKLLSSFKNLPADKLLGLLQEWRNTEEQYKQGFTFEAREYRHAFILYSKVGPQLLASYEQKLAALRPNQSPRDYVYPLPPETEFTRYRLNPNARAVELPDLEPLERQLILSNLQRDTDAAVAYASHKWAINDFLRSITYMGVFTSFVAAFVYDDIRPILLGGILAVSRLFFQLSSTDVAGLREAGKKEEERRMRDWLAQDRARALDQMQHFVASLTGESPNNVKVGIFGKDES